MIMINDAGHGERRDMAGRREGGRKGQEEDVRTERDIS
jgi:hypothetical protein